MTRLLTKHLSRNCTYAPSARTCLATLVVGCIFPMTLVAAFLLVNYYEREQTQLTANAIKQVRAMTAVLDREISTTQMALNVLSTSPSFAINDFASVHVQALRVLPHLHADSIVLTDTHGQLLLSTRRPFATALPKVTNPALVVLRQKLASGHSGVSDMFIGPLIGKPLFIIASPVRDKGVTTHSLSAAVLPAQVASVLQEQHLPNSWRASIIDSTGHIVARTHEIEKFVGKSVSADLMQRMQRTAEGGFKSTTLDGIPVLSAYSRSATTQWTVIVGIPLEELTAGLHQTLLWLVAASIAALVVGLLLAWYIGGHIAGSISSLTSTAVALISGEVRPIAPLYFQEANAMREALLDAATTLQQTRHAAHHDELTGLANRTLFRQCIEQQLALCRRNTRLFALLYVDLDGFKAVNDNEGHAVGDQLLCAVATRIKDSIRQSDIAARLGGDEFGIGLVDSDVDNAQTCAEKLLEVLSAPYVFGAREVCISASIGIAGYPTSGLDYDMLVEKADMAMYQAKDSGKKRCCVA